MPGQETNSKQTSSPGGHIADNLIFADGRPLLSSEMSDDSNEFHPCSAWPPERLSDAGILHCGPFGAGPANGSKSFRREATSELVGIAFDSPEQA